MTPTIGDSEEPAGGKVQEQSFLLPARRGAVSVEARKGGRLPELIHSASTRFVCQLAAFAVGFAVVRFATGATLHITISGYIPLWPALPLLLIWKAINRLLKP
jgi:hypothetical protein